MNNGKSDKEKTDIFYWNKLINSISLADFDKTPKGKSTAYIDGIDEILVITTSKGVHSVIIMPDSKKKYKNIKTFIDILSNKLKKYKIEMFY
jgi:hypothetical protein